MSLVLIVDDEADIRRILRRWIVAAGHEVVEAAGATAALEVVATRPADVALCDVQMPGDRDGLWLTTELRRRYPSMAVVLVTGVSTVPTVISLQSGVAAYLLKPFERMRLLEALASAVTWHENAKAAGPPPDDTAARLTGWLESIESTGL